MANCAWCGYAVRTSCGATLGLGDVIGQTETLNWLRKIRTRIQLWRCVAYSPLACVAWRSAYVRRTILTYLFLELPGPELTPFFVAVCVRDFRSMVVVKLVDW